MSSLGAERAGRLLHLAVELDQHRLHRPHDERQRHEEQREEDRAAREGEVDADRGARPVERRAAGGPATIVGSANGRSMTAFTTDLPRKSSRTSTQAVIVPSTAFDERGDRGDGQRELERRDRLRVR